MTNKANKQKTVLSIADLIAKNQSQSESGNLPQNTNDSKPLKVSNTELVKKYFNANYNFRYNTITDMPEWRKSTDTRFKPLDDYKLNSLSFELESKGSNVSTDKIFKLLKSDFVALVNPIEEYFEGLEVEGIMTGHIKKLTQTVKVDNPALFESHFTKWIVGVVANSLTYSGCQNHTCLVLTGDQGAYKTTWLTNLCPPTLKDYIFTGKIDVDKNDTQSMLSEFLIINIDDQLRNLNRKDENALKTLITLESVKVRRPYDRMITKRPRVASFCGSVNGNDFLTDPSGSRRFLPFEVRSIDLEESQKIDMDAVWAEALQLFRSDFRYWFTKEEINEINSYNQDFEVTDVETELLLELYEVTPRNSPDSEDLASSIILFNLETHFNTKLSVKKLGDALKKLNFVRFGKKVDGSPRYVYTVKRRIV